MRKVLILKNWVKKVGFIEKKFQCKVLFDKLKKVCEIKYEMKTRIKSNLIWLTI